MSASATSAMLPASVRQSESRRPAGLSEAERWPGATVGLGQLSAPAGHDQLTEERLVPADVATCSACRAELFDPADRRFGYAFVNCADCGPRYTIIDSLPYERERTSMRGFALCADCAGEYANPADRRFDAEPVACAACGPHLAIRSSSWQPLPGDPVEEAARLLRNGSIVAVKGLGGYHLACDATDDAVVAELRRRKRRLEQPLAVMVSTLAQAKELFAVGTAEADALCSPQAPIVLVHDLGKLARSVAPAHRRLGVMLPSTPVHHLLLRAAGRPLVMTSGNRSGEPMAIDDRDARRRLSSIADVFLVHDRAIVARAEDSVVRLWGETPLLLRRARGYAPSPIEILPHMAPTLGVGAELAGAFCLAAGRHAYLSPHAGDLRTEQSMAAYRAALDHYGRLFGIEPERVAHDLHPGFLTTRFAESTGLPAVAVQHHHAHVAAIMAEHQLEGKVIGVAFDGFGLGTDGTAWGGEFLICDEAAFERGGHLRSVPQPGGDAVVGGPVRMAIAHADDAGVLPEAQKLLHVAPARARMLLLGAGAAGPSPPFTSSAGRLFDAVAALTGACRRPTYKGQPAIELEHVAASSATFEYPFDLSMDAGPVVLDTRPVIEAIVKDLTRGRNPADVAGRFHRTLAAAVLAVCRLLRGRTGLDRVCLAGGIFHNDLLLLDAAARLTSVGFTVFVPQRVPMGGGGIALGQTLVAHARSLG